MKPFLDENFLLQTPTAERLYHEYAAPLPIIDYHNHLPPQQIAEDHNFQNLTQAWLAGDHYKWRAMRTAGVDESYCTGNKSDAEKFLAWARTVPYTLRNPLYHWTHLELQRYFDIFDLLNEHTAERIYADVGAQLQSPQFSVQNLLHKMKVEVVCTTDDPLDDLRFHQKFAAQDAGFKMFPAFRPDKAMQAENTAAFNDYVSRLEAVCNQNVSTFRQYLDALKTRHDFFGAQGCTVSDHGLECMYADDFTEAGMNAVFAGLRSGRQQTAEAVRKFKSAMLYYFAVWDFEKDWVQQYHLGAQRNNNTRMQQRLGADTGWDSIGDLPQAAAMAYFFNRLAAEGKLAKTIIYNLNPRDNAVFATMCGNFNDGALAGKMQWGSAWWFLDQKEGMEAQLNTLSHMGLISKFVGMLTDSRSFLSFPRHEYFRRILCNLFGGEMERGELPPDIEWTGKMVQDICYYNAANYFNWL